MSIISAGFAKFPNLELMQQHASAPIGFEQSGTPHYGSDVLCKVVRNAAPIFRDCYTLIVRLDQQINDLSMQTETVVLKAQIDQLILRRSDFQEAIAQNTSKVRETLVPVINFVRDLWRAFKPDHYRPTQSGMEPLVKWASGISAEKGPYTFTVEDIQILSIPGRYYQKGIIGWTAIAHEIGHDLLEGSGRLIDTLSSDLQQKLPESTAAEIALKKYFVSRVSEVAADIMGVLLLGPAAGVGLIAFLRAHREGFLSCTDPRPKGSHPVDIGRAFLVAYTINDLFPKDDAKETGPGAPLGAPVQDWNEYCEEMMTETLKDISDSQGLILIPVNQIKIHRNEFANYCKLTVKNLIEYLRLHVQFDKWRWGPKDEAIVDHIIQGEHFTARDSRHVVAAAFFESVQRMLVTDPAEDCFPIADLHTDHRALVAQENERIRSVFEHMRISLSRVKK